MDHVCTRCGRRQPAAPRCAGCGDDNLLDLAKDQTRELLHDMNQRRRDRREVQLRVLAVAIGIGVVVALWLVPGYWRARSQYFALPMLFDQWGFMILIAFGSLKLLSTSLAARPLFPFIDPTGSLKE
jgi:hypothetical protein